MNGSESPPPGVDLSLLRGFRFACRPGCALCCYTTPAVAPRERSALLRIAPSLPLELADSGPAGGFSRIPSWPDGGACRALAASRCTVHTARPFPCRSFPIVVHLHDRAQASLVLSCPGVDLKELPAWRSGAPPTARPVGLEEEVASVAREIATRPGSARGTRGYAHALRRLTRERERHGEQVDLTQVQLGLLRDPPLPGLEDLSQEDMPDRSAPLEELPLYFDEHDGRVAIRAAADGVWELLPIREEGGSEAVLGAFPPPWALPRTDASGERILVGYLAYVVRRDHFLGLLIDVALSSPRTTLEALARDLLRDVGAQVLARGRVRAMTRGEGGDRLDARGVEEGIRATDADLLDRRGVGTQL